MSDRSPCLQCDRLHEDKNDCALNCAALANFLSRPPADTRFQGEISMIHTANLSTTEAKKLGPADQEAIAAAAPSQDGPRCKKHPERPAQLNKNGKSLGLCLACLQDRGRQNAEASRKNPLPLPPEIKAALPLNELLENLLAKFPAFNADWPPVSQEKWFEGFILLLKMVR